jgi:ABC-type sugar transport system substrate-binding protein
VRVAQHKEQLTRAAAKHGEKIMNSKLIAVALVSAAAALGSPAFAQDASYGAPSYGRSYAAAVPHRTNSFRGAYNQAPADSHALAEPEFYNNGWVTEGAVDRSRPGGLDPDFRPAD